MSKSHHVSPNFKKWELNWWLGENVQVAVGPIPRVGARTARIQRAKICKIHPELAVHHGIFAHPPGIRRQNVGTWNNSTAAEVTEADQLTDHLNCQSVLKLSDHRFKQFLIVEHVCNFSFVATYVNIHKHIAHTFFTHIYHILEYNISHISQIRYQYQNILTFFYPLAIQLPWPGWPGIDPSSVCRHFGSGEGVERGSAGCERLSFDRTVLKNLEA